MTMITPSYLGETIEYSSLHACRSTLEDPTRNVGQYPTALLTTVYGLFAFMLSAVAAQDIQQLGNRPTFDCSKARSGVARSLCLDQAGAKADWNLISAYWARRFLLEDSSRKTFDLSQISWLTSLNQVCGLLAGDGAISAGQKQCVTQAYHKRAEQYRAALSGDALIESRLTPEEHALVQYGLLAAGYLGGAADVDGEFGPRTRAAIRQFNSAKYLPPRDFLASAHLSALVAEARKELVSAAKPVAPTSTSPPPSTANVPSLAPTSPTATVPPPALPDFPDRPNQSEIMMSRPATSPSVNAPSTSATSRITPDPDFGSALALFFSIVVIVFVIHWLPTIIAFRRRHPNRWLIFVLNLATGVSVIGWLLALIWALHVAHRSASTGGSDGGESGLNILANDYPKIEATPDRVGRLDRLKVLLDSGAISNAEYATLKAEVLS